MAAVVTVTGGVVAALALPGWPAQPVRVYIDCRRAGGGPGSDGTSLHVLWQRSPGLLKVPGDTSGVLAQVEFDGDGAIDLPEGCGVLSLTGGSGNYNVGIYDCRKLPPGLYVPRERQLGRMVNVETNLTIPEEHFWIGAMMASTPVATSSDGIISELTPTPERCVPGQLYTFGGSARIFTQTQAF